MVDNLGSPFESAPYGRNSVIFGVGDFVGSLVGPNDTGHAYLVYKSK